MIMPLGPLAKKQKTSYISSIAYKPKLEARLNFATFKGSVMTIVLIAVLVP